jgi:hypothetical protein
MSTEASRFPLHVRELSVIQRTGYVSSSLFRAVIDDINFFPWVLGQKFCMSRIFKRLLPLI